MIPLSVSLDIEKLGRFRISRVRLAFALAILSTLVTRGASAQQIDRALSFTDSGYVNLGDPGDSFDFAPGGERAFVFWMRNDSPEYHTKLLDKARRAERSRRTPGWIFDFCSPVCRYSRDLHGAAR